jgi:aminopeptidase
MLAELPHSTRHARSFPSLLLLACSAICVVGCDRPKSAELGSESAAVRPDSAEPEAVPVADFKSVAVKVVQQSAGVRERDIVLIAGSDEDLPLLEEIAIEVRKLGGQPLVTVTTERFRRRAYDEVPPSTTARPQGSP